MENTYIGIDIGTSATKAVCFDRSGNVVRQCSRSYEMKHPQPDWSVQNPELILVAVRECIQEITLDNTPEFISFSSAMQSCIAIDQDGIPLTEAMLWADNRAHDMAVLLKVSEKGQTFYAKTGIPIHSFSPMMKMLWLKEHDPKRFAQSYKFISIKEYIWQQLTGEYAIDSSMASGTGLMNIHTLEWDTDILDYLQIGENQLSPIVGPTHLKKGLADDFTYFIGGGDGVLANLGTGAMEVGNMALSIGTSGAVRIPIEQPFINSEMRTQCYHLMDNQYLKLGAVNNGAIVLQWLKESLLKTEESYEELFQQADTVAPGSEGLLFVPYLLGERAPIWDAAAQGTLLGIRITHTKAHLIRATLEGILFGLFSVTELLIPDTEKRQNIIIRASGGFGKSELWLQMVADIFQMKVVVAETVEASAWGAVLLGFKAFGLESSKVKDSGKTFLPNPDHKAVYRQSFEKFKKIYPLLKDLDTL